MEFSTTNEMSKIWNISPRRISLLCSQGRVEGAVKKGKIWLIPSRVNKPEDPRRMNK
ncbi:DNA-binding protein [Cellulosilyticum sp. WCF-2]|uniref:DNA-binding protein n=1 Tax=Cellulosilyticum sp. WCF-2 TaxID=2497860 RepID=UPI000F8CB73B|nr:DNA-binding protein [Cellulosilyticum sp. WCF-2]QEH69321.1 helix-turn-helix domain-containing protein [Cellulosilyticum sp. WCF-2]